MSQRYFSDAPGSIEALFILEGDALRRAGFSYPDMSQVPEGFNSEQQIDNSTETLASPADEAAWLGVDVEVILEG